MERQFLTPEDVAEDIQVSLEDATELIRQMVKQLRDAGYVAVAGRIQRKYYEKQKEAGFMMARKEIEREDPVRLDEKRLLSIGEFCTYASIGRERGIHRPWKEERKKTAPGKLQLEGALLKTHDKEFYYARPL